MKIAMISIPYHSTPPKGYGGIEKVVYELTEELIRQGHEVVLFGAPRSYCSGKTIEISYYDPEKAPSGVTKGREWLSEEPLYEAIKSYLEENPVDVIHDWSFENLYVIRHLAKFPFVISSCIPPTRGYRRPNLVAASKAHAKLLKTPRYVHYGLNLEKYHYSLDKFESIIHIAKIAPYKGQHLAVFASLIAKRKIRFAGNVEDEKYFKLVKMLPGFNYIGEIYGVNNHLKHAKALVQTPRWFEVFPLVVLEAFASATPVIALSRGGLSEQVKNGVNGFLCNNLFDLAKAMKSIEQIDPKACRAYAEEHFSVKLMAERYVEIYESAIKGEKW